VNSLHKTVTGQRRDCDLNPGPSAPESSSLTTRLPSHSTFLVRTVIRIGFSNPGFQNNRRFCNPSHDPAGITGSFGEYGIYRYNARTITLC